MAPRQAGTPRPVSRRRSLTLVATALVSWLGAARGVRAEEQPEFRVVVHPSNRLRSAERAFLADAFLKKVTRWEGGQVIRPVDLRSDNRARRRFSENVLKRSVGAVRSYWQQRIFSGRDVPPVELDSDESVVAFVAKSEGAVGYVSGAAKLTGVRELVIQ